jgi:hypothetical protein
MSNRALYNTATGRALCNPATGRALYLDQHIISAFSGAITFQHGVSMVETCYSGPGAYNTFGLAYAYTVTRLSNFNKITRTIGFGGNITSYSIEYLPSLKQLRFEYDRTWDYLSIPELGVDEQYHYLGYFGQSTPTVGMPGVYDTVVSQSCWWKYNQGGDLDYGPSETTEQEFSFTLALQ